MPRIIVNNPRNVIDAHLKTNYFKLKNTGGPKGDKGDTGDAGPMGPTGPMGPQGPTGAAATVTVGSTTTLEPGQSATVNNSGTSGAAVLNFGIPKGEKGDTGATGATGATGPQGPTGATGATGPQGPVGSVKSTVVSELPESGNSDTFYLVDREATTGTASGTFITLDNPEPNGEISDYDILGKAEQDGTPTPDAPVAVETTTGENTVKITGKNLYNNDLPLDNKYLSGDGKWLPTTYSVINQEIPATASTTYTWSASSTTGAPNLRLGEFDSSGNFIRRLLITQSTSRTFTTTATTALIVTSTDNTDINKYNDPQLELGSTATAYEPYQGQEFEVNLGSIELAKIGDYQDRIYKNDGKWYVEKQVGKVVLDGTESWATQNDAFVRNLNEIAQGEYNAEILMVSDHFTGRKTCYRAELTDGQCAKIVGANQQIAFRYNALNNVVADWKTWLGTHNTIVYYALTTPTTTEITNEALITQLEELLNAELYTGQNNISSTSTANLAGPLDITYAFFDKTNRHKVYIWSDSDNTWQIIVQ